MAPVVVVEALRLRNLRRLVLEVQVDLLVLVLVQV
jgi:hypothetical protein